jgi:hypothetical protein
MFTKNISLGLGDEYETLEQVGILRYFAARGSFDVNYTVAEDNKLCYHDARLVKLMINGTEYPLTPVQATVLEVALEHKIIAKLESTL